MVLKSRVVIEVVDTKNDKIISRDELLDINIERPETIDQIGLETSTQQQLVQATADKLIELQGPLINEHKKCPKCKHKVVKSGKTTCEVHSLNSEHTIEIQKYKCPKCYWTSSDSIKKMYGTDVHTSLTKIQAELGSNYSYRKVVSILKLLSFEQERPVNNKERIKRVLTKVGDIISTHNLESITDVASPASELIVHVDGAHVASMEKNKRSFEVMTGTVYKPEDVKVVNKNENVISNKICVASAKEDKQESMKIMLVNAAKSAGMCKSTKITAFSDGAANCKSVIRSLSDHCLNLEVILDWFHIAMKFQNIIPALPEDQQEIIKRAKWKLWHGLPDECLTKLEISIEKIEDEVLQKRTIKLVQYLNNNKDVLINYEERKNSDRPFTSNVAESTVENLVNSRCRQTGKMKWLRDGAHALLQIKCAHYSKSFNKIWQHVVPKLLPQTTLKTV